MHDIRHARRDKELQKYARKNRNAAPPRKAEAEAHGTVGAVHAGGCVVHLADERRLCRPFPGAAVGDQVAVAAHNILSIGERRSVLSRPDPSNRRLIRVLAANVEVAVIVASAAQPPFRPGLVDRMLIAIERGGIEPILCLNKADLGTADLSDWESAGVRTVRTAAQTGEGIDALADLIRGQTCVFAGHSGVGKSSLVNALDPGLALRIGEVGRKGRHTTTSSHLLELAGGTRIIDTPGIREFGLSQIARDELREYFPEFEPYAGLCRFRGCSHVAEPDCAVRAAEPGRYGRYLRLFESLDG